MGVDRQRIEQHGVDVLGIGARYWVSSPGCCSRIRAVPLALLLFLEISVSEIEPLVVPGRKWSVTKMATPSIDPRRMSATRAAGSRELGVGVRWAEKHRQGEAAQGQQHLVRTDEHAAR